MAESLQRPFEISVQDETGYLTVDHLGHEMHLRYQAILPERIVQPWLYPEHAEYSDTPWVEGIMHAHNDRHESDSSVARGLLAKLLSEMGEALPELFEQPMPSESPPLRLVVQEENIEGFEWEYCQWEGARLSSTTHTSRVDAIDQAGSENINDVIVETLGRLVAHRALKVRPVYEKLGQRIAEIDSIEEPLFTPAEERAFARFRKARDAS
jgi:hypothetical protein